MARFIIFLTSLFILLSLQPTNAVEYTVTNRAEGTPGGTRFTTAIGSAYSKQILESASKFIWRTFNQNRLADKKNVEQVWLYVDNMDGETYTTDNEIHLSAKYIAEYSGNLRREIIGVYIHELVHIWQWNGEGEAPGWLTEGIADYVRFKAGYAPSHWVEPGEGDRWDHGHDVTAHFLNYCNSLKNGFVAELNYKMKHRYIDHYFVELLGKTISQLWRDYKRKYAH